MSWPAERFGPMRDLKGVGRGMTGSVYQTYDRSLGRTVAIKAIAREIPEMSAHVDLVRREEDQHKPRRRQGPGGAAARHAAGDVSDHRFVANLQETGKSNVLHQSEEGENGWSHLQG